MVEKKLYNVRIKAEYFIRTNSEEIARQETLKEIVKDTNKIEVNEVREINKYPEEKEENKTIIVEDRIHKKDAIETEVVTVTLLAQTDKGLQIIFNGIEDWIPKSKIHNEYEFIQDQETKLIIERWVLEKNFKWVKK